MTTQTLRYDKEITALLVIDPYNDFISEGGKIWDCLKAVAEANQCVSNMFGYWFFGRPIDIIFGKLHRLVEKDCKAIDLLREEFGRPTREDIDMYCRDNADLFLKDPGTLERLCSNIDALVSRYGWETIPVRDYSNRAWGIYDEVRTEGRDTLKVIDRLAGPSKKPAGSRNKPEPEI
jgi:hypothetical protein